MQIILGSTRGGVRRKMSEGRSGIPDVSTVTLGAGRIPQEPFKTATEGTERARWEQKKWIIQVCEEKTAQKKRKGSQ